MARRVVDLTLPIKAGMARFPTYWHPEVEVGLLGRIENEGRETRRLVLGTHSGTHCDAPRHFLPGGAGVDALDLAALVGPARVLDLTTHAPGGCVEAEDLQAALEGRVPERLILRYDWSRQWEREAYYCDHPYLSRQAARWLVAGGLKLLAMDSPTPDNPADGRSAPEDSPVHKILLGAGVILVEYLDNLAALTRPWVELIALPLKIEGADGSPCRVVAVEED